MKCAVYILKSSKSGVYYIGYSIYPNSRTLQHNEGQVRATKSKGPWDMVFCQFYLDVKTARQVEYKVKKLKRKDIIERIIQDGEIKLKI